MKRLGSQSQGNELKTACERRQLIDSKDDNDSILIKQLIGESHSQDTFNTAELKLSCAILSTGNLIISPLNGALYYK